MRGLGEIGRAIEIVERNRARACFVPLAWLASHSIARVRASLCLRLLASPILSRVACAARIGVHRISNPRVPSTKAAISLAFTCAHTAQAPIGSQRGHIDAQTGHLFASCRERLSISNHLIGSLRTVMLRLSCVVLSSPRLLSLASVHGCASRAGCDARARPMVRLARGPKDRGYYRAGRKISRAHGRPAQWNFSRRHSETTLLTAVKL